MEQHPLQKRLPDDVDWEEFESLELRRQCIVRNIPSDKTSREHKIRLLQEYHNTHVTEVRKVPWCRRQDMLPISERYSRMGTSSYQITRVKDKSASNGTVFRKDFTLSDEKGSTCIVAFKEIPTCTCRSQSFVQYHCQHIMYLLRFVLKCPEPLLWQAAFLPSELEVIYGHSHAIRTLLRTDKETQDTVCVLCFKSQIDTRKILCCPRAMHRDCVKVVMRVRKWKQGSRCWICEDIAEWDIEKYREQNQIPAATTSEAVVTAAANAATIASAMPTPTTSIVQQSIEHKDKDDHDAESSSSSKKQDDRDAQANNNLEINQRPSHPPQSSSSFSSSSSNFPTPSQSDVNQQELLPPPSPQQSPQASKDVAPQLKFSTSLPAVPLQKSTSAALMSNSEHMRLELEQQKAQERVEKPSGGGLLSFSPALANDRSPAPSVEYSSPNAAAARALSLGRAGQTPVLSTAGIDSRDSASMTATVTDQIASPAPAGGTPGYVNGPPPLSADADIRQQKAAKLVRKCRRLEKKTSQMQEHAEHEIKKIDKEYKQKLKRLEEKRKRIDKKREEGLKKLRHTRKRLEKELKAFERS